CFFEKDTDERNEGGYKRRYDTDNRGERLSSRCGSCWLEKTGTPRSHEQSGKHQHNNCHGDDRYEIATHDQILAYRPNVLSLSRLAAFTIRRRDAQRRAKRGAEAPGQRTAASRLQRRVGPQGLSVGYS